MELSTYGGVYVENLNVNMMIMHIERENKSLIVSKFNKEWRKTEMNA